ncbi:hypothetical protein [Enhygromyxa salina]|uniref:Uncharacterized protein n=1 Tax=Enhygromyxa salina TaxID=215803 RepID=A0A2S9YNI6_9BACT|nr:hypothetical protein [Enhygromyxa salina]PRQ06651.1 hypothetical protein ENSA7_35270 [Enhygromyxa salina]
MRNSGTTITMVITSYLLGGCLVLKDGNLEGGDEDTTGAPGDGDGSSDSDGGGDGDGDQEPPVPISIDGDGCQAGLDILLILDNSGSMGKKQALLAGALFDPLLSSLELDGLDWRLAVTTTDIGGNPWCVPNGNPPEDGHFQLRSCNEHLDDFVFNGETDARDIACNDICAYPPGKIHTLETTTADDPQPASRPWLERIGGKSNLSMDLDPVAAALCLVPQGINGCGYEQPLEAMAAALELATTPGNAESGFLRDEAGLLVVIVTDEADCSFADESIFLPEGERTFWSDPNDAFPTSAVCWNAGVSCTGDPSGYDDCVAADFDVHGSPTAPALAVLRPVAGYIDVLRQIEQQKRALDPGADVSVLVISGVGTDGELHYGTAAGDEAFEYSFGIGPGCEAAAVGGGESVQAVPPVRLREVGEAMSSEALASICASSYFDALSGVYDRLLGACE